VLIQPDASGDDVFATFDVLEHAGIDFPTIGIPLIYELDNSPGKPFAASVRHFVD